MVFINIYRYIRGTQDCFALLWDKWWKTTLQAMFWCIQMICEINSLYDIFNYVISTYKIFNIMYTGDSHGMIPLILTWVLWIFIDKFIFAMHNFLPHVLTYALVKCLVIDSDDIVFRTIHHSRAWLNANEMLLTDLSKIAYYQTTATKIPEIE